ncbi:acVLRF1 family peptidyl-tRNA hydrolase [Specibacter cremeus]|uniref:acVLRF1 family peptidyl-tRNA hydrolase n=1 Tax=Specibacter cremeus TaxID=1629051 RepID=UPI000F795007|nr:acVLRF1 family peptidyl-tRNA hydrolase [Specibacter cremeus]
MNTPTRTAFVSAARLSGWVERFSAAHGGLAPVEDTDDGVVLRAHDGAVALLAPPWPDAGRPGRGPDLVSRLSSLATQERRFGVLLVRRGGYAVGVAVSGTLLVHKCGTKYVQSRTAAGGQSQHRFARRRANQADGLVERTALEAARVFAGQDFEYVAVGGDRALVDAVLAEPALRPFAGRPRVAPIAVGDPNLAVLVKAAADFCAIRVRVSDPR